MSDPLDQLQKLNPVSTIEYVKITPDKITGVVTKWQDKYQGWRVSILGQKLTGLWVQGVVVLVTPDRVSTHLKISVGDHVELEIDSSTGLCRIVSIIGVSDV